MKIHVFKNKEIASEFAYTEFAKNLEQGAHVFGLATGGTPEILYQLLRESDLDFSNCVSINLDEYYGLDGNHPKSYRYYMQTQLFDVKPFNTSYLPDGTDTNVQSQIDAYNQIIAENPIDLQLLGLGVNGHIGFNEPGSPFDGQTSLVDLTANTIEANSRYFATKEEVPTQAYSMGIGSILKANKIILLAFGPKKADAVFGLAEGPITVDLPASSLQTHPDVTIILDEEAASQLSRDSYIFHE